MNFDVFTLRSVDKAHIFLCFLQDDGLDYLGRDFSPFSLGCMRSDRPPFTSARAMANNEGDLYLLSSAAGLSTARSSTVVIYGGISIKRSISRTKNPHRPSLFPSTTTKKELNRRS